MLTGTDYGLETKNFAQAVHRDHILAPRVGSQLEHGLSFRWHRGDVSRLGSSTALAAGDAAAGQQLFASHCGICHATEPGVNKRSPTSLHESRVYSQKKF